MKRILLFSVVLAIFAAFAITANGQCSQRITFKKGTKKAVVTGSLTGYKGHKTFVIRVKAGQTLTTENAGGPAITVSIEAPPGSTYEQDMAADCHDRNEVTPTAAGDYKIMVTECRKAQRWRGKFKLRVTVR